MLEIAYLQRVEKCMAQVLLAQILDHSANKYYNNNNDNLIISV